MTGYQRFFQGINDIFTQISTTQGENIELAARLIAEAILHDGVLHVFGTGHSNIIAEEVFGRANTLAPINQVWIYLAGTVNTVRSFFMERVEGIGELIFEHIRTKPQDVVLVISNSGRNAVPIDFARSAKEHGNKVIVETSVAFSLSQPSRHSSGKRLLDYADVVLDNKTPFADIVVKVEG
jgi:uncharacterized phosphosugar-binding protein